MTMSMSNTDSPADSGARFRILALAVVALVAVVVAAILLVGGDDDDDDAATVTTVDSSAPATAPPATEPPVTEPVATDPPPTDPPATDPPDTTTPGDDTSTAIWPWADTPERFDDPVDAAAGYATDFLGFTDPVLGEFRAGDSRSGEVEVRPGDDVELVTVVFVRQLGADDDWWVLGSAAENIVVDEPETLSVVESPLNLSGSALAFEGTVEVEVRADGQGEAIATGFVTGSGPPEAGPFEGTIEFDSPGPGGGALVFISRSPADGTVLEATSLRIFFE
jgi:hypothetical protein